MSDEVNALMNEAGQKSVDLAQSKQDWWTAKAEGNQRAMDAAHAKADLLRSQGAVVSDEVNAMISEAGQKTVTLAQSKEDWWAAYKRGDLKGMTDAHNRAEALRAQGATLSEELAAKIDAAGRAEADKKPSEAPGTQSVGLRVRIPREADKASAGNEVDEPQKEALRNRIPVEVNISTPTAPAETKAGIDRSDGVKLPITRIKQGFDEDTDWWDVDIGNTKVGPEGCVVTSYIMAESYLNNTSVSANRNTFDTVARTAVDGEGNLTPEKADPVFGVKSTKTGASGYNEDTYVTIRKALENGYPVIVGGGAPGKHHFVVVSGYSGTGTEPSQFTIRDPGGLDRKTLQVFQNEYSLNEVWFISPQ